MKDDSDYDSMFGESSDDEDERKLDSCHTTCTGKRIADNPKHESKIEDKPSDSEGIGKVIRSELMVESSLNPTPKDDEENSITRINAHAMKSEVDLRDENSSSRSEVINPPKSVYIDESLFGSSSDEDNIDDEVTLMKDCKGMESGTENSTFGEVKRPFASQTIPKKKRKTFENILLQYCEINQRATENSSRNYAFQNDLSNSSNPRDEYPTIDVDHFWRAMRSWNFLDDLNQHMKDAQNGARKNVTLEPCNTSRDNDTDIINDNTAKLSQSYNGSLETSSIPQIPNIFRSHEQYVASWAPLQLRETKAQILSDVYSRTTILPNMLVPVKVVVDSGNDQYTDYLNLHILPNHNHISNSNSGMTPRLNAKTRPSKDEFILITTTDKAKIEMAWKGSLHSELNMRGQTETLTKKKVSWSPSLVSSASPFIENRLAVIGHVLQRNRQLDNNGFRVQVSRRLWRENAKEPYDMFMYQIGHSVTALREFKALCNVKNMPLMKYLLSPKRAPNCEQLSEVGVRNGPLSEMGGPNALGIGFRIWVKSRFNNSQLAAINAAAREYGDGGFTLVKGPPGTGKTTTLVALLNALHSRQYQRYYSEIERITLAAKSENSMSETLVAINAAAKFKPRILVCAPSNSAVDNVILKIIENRFVDGNGGRYSPSIIRVGSGQSASVIDVSLNQRVESVVSESSNMQALLLNVRDCRKEVQRLQKEINNLQKRVRLIAKASPYKLSKDWEIRIDEENFEKTPRVIFVNHKLKTVSLVPPPPPNQGEPLSVVKEMPHYRECMNSLVKYIERHSALHSRLEQRVLVHNTAAALAKTKYSHIMSNLNQQIEKHILDSAHIVMTTLGTAGSNALERAAKFEVVVIDEAAQSSEPATLAALQLGSSHAILVGDPQQLPATIFSVSGRVTKFDRSLFQRLEDSGHFVNMLNIQYRMAPKISSFPRRIFYDGSLLDGPNVLSPDYGLELNLAITSTFRYFQPFTVFDICGEEERGGTSLSNPIEASFALHLFCSLAKSTTGMTKKSRVAIITPYQQQVTLLHSAFENHFGCVYNRMVDISTVDAYQGKEADIVIFSCVRSAEKEIGIGFLSDVKRMNVALTRAKHFLFVIASIRTILVNPYWRDLVTHAQEQGAIIKATPRIIRSSSQDEKLSGRSMENSSKFTALFPELHTLEPQISDISNK